MSDDVDVDFEDDDDEVPPPADPWPEVAARLDLEGVGEGEATGVIALVSWVPPRSRAKSRRLTLQRDDEGSVEIKVEAGGTITKWQQVQRADWILDDSKKMFVRWFKVGEGQARATQRELAEAIRILWGESHLMHEPVGGAAPQRATRTPRAPREPRAPRAPKPPKPTTIKVKAGVIEDTSAVYAMCQDCCLSVRAYLLDENQLCPMCR